MKYFASVGESDKKYGFIIRLNYFNHIQGDRNSALENKKKENNKRLVYAIRCGKV